jgi:hypothetical protein
MTAGHASVAISMITPRSFLVEQVSIDFNQCLLLSGSGVAASRKPISAD